MFFICDFTDFTANQTEAEIKGSRRRTRCYRRASRGKLQTRRIVIKFAIPLRWIHGSQWHVMEIPPFAFACQVDPFTRWRHDNSLHERNARSLPGKGVKGTVDGEGAGTYPFSLVLHGGQNCEILERENIYFLHFTWIVFDFSWKMWLYYGG